MSLLKIHREAGDRNLGATLMRLASLAAQSHQYEEAGNLLNSNTDNLESMICTPDVHLQHTDVSAVRKEVNR